jgi:hypothetical protein
MTTTTSTTFAAVAVWGSTSTAASTTNPTNANTTMVGGKVQFENDNYRIAMGDDNTVHVTNKNTGETYLAWGDPHMNIDGKHTFDFWGTTTLALDDGTKVTIETTPWVKDPSMTLSSKVTITNGDYGVQVSGIDTNRVGDLKFEEAEGWGRLTDALTADGNVLYENTHGSGFLGIDRQGRLRPVDQQFINETDLQKGGALQARFGDMFQAFAGLMAVSFLGGFLSALRGNGGSDNDVRQPVTPRAPQLDDGSAFLMVLGRGNGQGNGTVSWFVAAATATSNH